MGGRGVEGSRSRGAPEALGVTPPDSRLSTPDSAIAMRAISKRFGSVVANDRVDFEAAWGEVVRLAEENAEEPA